MSRKRPGPPSDPYATPSQEAPAHLAPIWICGGSERRPPGLGQEGAIATRPRSCASTGLQLTWQLLCARLQH